MLLDTWATVHKLEGARVVLATIDADTAELDLGRDAAISEQGEGDLGQRMERVLRRALRRHSEALLLGTDLPGLPLDRLQQARAALQAGTDAVLGPAEDGGFYLIGLRRCPESLLEGLPWSRGDTLRHTVRQLRQRGLTVELVESWSDVDCPGDLDGLVERLAQREINAPHTEQVLREMELL
jgi:rSAM/selenodomain-associated transferase 1